MKPVILDTGPLVAWFCARDEHHAWARQTFAEISPGGFICEAVIAEVCHLVAKEGIARGRVIEFAERGGLTVFPLGGELPAIRTLLDRYTDTPMAFADACVVRLAELHADLPVCTTDGHFRFFRMHGSEITPIIAPFAA
jgi:hypothetical protein